MSLNLDAAAPQSNAIIGAIAAKSIHISGISPTAHRPSTNDAASLNTLEMIER